MRRRGIVAISIGLLVVLTYAYAGSRNVIPVVLNHHEFRIPAEQVLSGVPFWVRAVPRIQENPKELLILIEADQLRNKIPNYIQRVGEYDADTIVNIMALSPEKAATYKDPNYPLYRDAWMAEGKYKNRVVEVHEPSGLYKVSNPDYDFYWSALKMKPDSSQSIPTNIQDFWVGHCGKTPTPNLSGKILTTCHVSGFYGDNIFFDFRVIGENLKFYEQMRDVIIDQLRVWEVKNLPKEL